MLIKLRGNIGDTIIYNTGNGGIHQSEIVYVEITVYENMYDVSYVLENGKRVDPKEIVDIQHRPIKDIEVLDTIN